MKATFKTLVIAIVAMICSVAEASAQKVSAVAIVEKHYAAETAHYKIMMLGLVMAYGVYVMLCVRRKREVNRFLGKTN